MNNELIAKAQEISELSDDELNGVSGGIAGMTDEEEQRRREQISKMGSAIKDQHQATSPVAPGASGALAAQEQLREQENKLREIAKELIGL